MPDRIDDLYSEKWFADMERTIQLLEKQESAINAVNDAIKAGSGDARNAKTMEDLAAAQSKVSTATAQAAAGFDDFNTALKQAEALKSQYNGSTKEMVAITLSSAKATKTLAEAARIQSATADKAAKAAQTEGRLLKDLTDERALLSKALREQEVRYANLSFVAGKSNAATKEALAQTLAMRKALDEVNHKIGRYGDNVGNYAGKFNSLGFAVRNIASELPNAGISFRTFAQSLSNNIGPLQQALTEARLANEALVASGGKAIPIWKQLGSTIFSFNTLLLALVAVFVNYTPQIEEFFSTIFKGKGSMDALKLATEQYKKALQSTEFANAISQFDELEQNIQLAKDGLLDKDKVMKLYNDTLGKTIGQVKTWDELESNVVKKKDAYLQMMLLKATATAAYTEAAKKAVEAEIAAQTIQSGKPGAVDYAASILTNGLVSPEISSMARATEVGQAALDQSKAISKIGDDYQKRAAEIAKKFNFDFFGGTQDEKEKRKKSAADLTNELLKAKADETKALYQQLQINADIEAENQEQIARDEHRSLQVRADAYDDFTRQKLMSVGFGLAAEGEVIEQSLAEISEIEKKAEADRTQEQKLLLLKKATLQQQLTNLTGKYQLAETKLLNDAINFRLELQDKADATELKRKKKHLQDMADAVGNNNFSTPSDNPEDKANKQYEEDKKKRAEAYAFVDDIATAYSGFTQQRIQEIDEEIEAIRKRRDAEIESYQLSAEYQFATERDKAIKIAAIKNQAQAQEDQQLAKRRQEQRRDAAIHKAITVAKIAIETALAVVHQLGSGDPYTAFGRAAAVGLLGAAQLAAAIAQPLPEYEEGTKGIPHPGGPARVSEKGSELAIGPDGKMFLTPNEETIMYLSKGTQVIPADQTAELMKMYALGVPGLRSNNDRTTEVLSGLKENAAIIAGAIKDKRFPLQRSTPAWYEQRLQQYRR